MLKFCTSFADEGMASQISRGELVCHILFLGHDVFLSRVVLNLRTQIQPLLLGGQCDRPVFPIRVSRISEYGMVSVVVVVVIVV